MSQRAPRNRFRNRLALEKCLRNRFHRLSFEPLEDRTMLDSGGLRTDPSSLVVGRTLSTGPSASPAYFSGEVQGGQVTITYTVYNEQADPETGALLTTTLGAGVTVAGASPQPDQTGQNLSWSLGTIGGFGRASVSVSVNLPSSGTTQLDTGAQAFVTLDDAAITNTAPPATLRSGTVDPSLLASTPDANTADPYIQNEAALLDYNPQEIFDFLHSEVGYNSYLGSVRGARGTLWSLAGNALDVASLGVALMRASGVPAQYVSGTLPQAQAQTLIDSMFSVPFQTIGSVPAGSATSDPANDPTLLAETEAHDWFQFDTGSGMQDADPLMAGATVGQAFTAPTGTFSEVPAALRETTEVQITAEITSQGLLGPTSRDTVVLDHTFNDVDLVGHPLTIGNLVSGGSAGFIISATTYTYTPYIAIGDDASPDPKPDELIFGSPYQEVFSNFPFVSSEVTGLFLNVTLSGPQGAPQSYAKTLVDNIGYDVRLHGGTPVGSGQPVGSPSINPTDVWSMSVQAAVQDPTPLLTYESELESLDADLGAALAAGQNGDVATDLNLVLTDQTRDYLTDLMTRTDQDTQILADGALVASYAARPRIVVVSGGVSTVTTQGVTQALLTYETDLVNDTERVVAAPGQPDTILLSFNFMRGIVDNEDEVDALPQPVTSGSLQVSTAVGALPVLAAAQQQNIAIVTLGPGDDSALDGLAIPADARDRITAALEAGNVVTVPSQEVTINGLPTIAWLQTNPQTGETTGVGEDGAHQAVVALAAVGVTTALLAAVVIAVLPGYLREQGATAATAAFNTIDIVAALSPSKGLAKAHPFKDLGYVEEGDSKADVKFKVRQALLRLVQSYKVTHLEDDGALVSKFFNEGFDKQIDALEANFEAKYLNPNDPAEPDALIAAPSSDLAVSETAGLVTAPGGNLAGSVAGAGPAPGVSVDGALAASWSGSATAGFQVGSISATGATVRNASGVVVGSGAVDLSTASLVDVAVSGSVNYSVQGTGQLSFYGSAATGLVASGDWSNDSATLTGGMSLTLTTGALMVNGTLLPAGTYSITAGAATLAGSGPSTSPAFAGSASVTASSASLVVPAGSNGINVGGTALDPGSGATLGGYTGTVQIGANGQATFSGSATSLLQVVPTTTTLTTDQNTAASLTAAVHATVGGSYSIYVHAPVNWGVTLDTQGDITVTPAPGTQGGSYPLEILAQSEADPSIEEVAFVNVTVTPTAPGFTFTVPSDPDTTVPVNGALLPTGFAATVQNTGPTTDTYNLTFSAPPTGFTFQNGPASLTVPAGQTGVSGVYLVPTGGIPAPGTLVSFTVTATSTTNPSQSKTQTVTFSVPAVDALTVTGNATVSTIPGGPVTETVTLTNVGNVPETGVSLASTQSTGLTVTGLTPVSLAVGQSTTETITLTPATATLPNSLLQTIITATYGPSGAPLTETLPVAVQVAVPGAAAISTASLEAQQVGNDALADRLSDLSTALTNLVQNPTSAVYKSQATADINSVVGQLDSDPMLTAFAGPLTAGQAALSAATTTTNIQAAVVQIGNALGSLNTALADEVNSRFTASISPGTAIAQPASPSVFNVDLLNNGGETTTYDLSVSGLPADVSAQFNTKSVTLSPGQQAGPITLTLTETGSGASATGFTVTVTPEGASELAESLAGALTVRADLVDVVSVAPSPAYTAAGGQVSVSARVLNAVNQARQALASYTVTNASNQVVFTSTAVPVSLGVQTSLATVDLGTLNTTGLADGVYTLDVSLTDTSGHAIPGASGSGTLLIGTPVNATLTVTPTALPAGNGTVTDSLTIDPNPANPSGGGGPLTLTGQVQTTAVGEDVALSGTLAYVAGTGGIDVVDISDPTAPKVVNSFGQTDVLTGGLAFARISGTELIVGYQSLHNAGSMRLLIYSIAADPTNPTLLSKSTLSPAYVSAMFVQGNDLFLSTDGDSYAGTTLIGQFGDFVAVDISNPASPQVLTALSAASSPPSPNRTNEYSAVPVTSQVAYVAGTNSTGGVASGQSTTTGEGRLLIVNTSTPASPKLSTPVGQLLIPGTNRLLGLAIDGDRALVFGSSEGYDSLGHMQGNITLSVLDVTNPLSPVQLGTTLVTSNTNADQVGGATPDDLSQGMALALGGGMFAVSGTLLNGSPVIELVDITDPNNLVVTSVSAPSVVYQMATAGGKLYATSASGLTVYNIGSLGNTPVTASVTIPNGTGVSVVPGSFNVAPTQVITGTDSDTLVWNTDATGPVTYTWQTAVSGLQPGEDRVVTGGGTVSYTSQGTSGSVALPAQSVTGDQIIGLSPASQTAVPGAPASYEVILTNPTASSITYHLSVLGVPARWVSLVPTVTVPASGSVNVPLTLTSDTYATTGETGFTVAVNDDAGAASSVSGDLNLQGQAATLDTQAHGVVVALTPALAVTGVGDSAQYVVKVTNTGSADETFALSLGGLSQGVSAVLGQTTVDVPPGAGNFREVTLTLTAGAGSSPGDDPFQVTATSTTNASVSNTASGTLNVEAEGVRVALTSSSGSTGSGLQLTVTNTGRVADTFGLTLGGSAALTSTLATSQVTLAPGASKVVPITTGSTTFSPSGALSLTAVATSQANPSVRAETSFNLTVPDSVGFSAQVSPASQTLPTPGPVSLALMVKNTGTADDGYQAVIYGMKGPVTASLVGFDGLPTQSIPSFYLPALTPGQIQLNATLSGYGTGTVLIQVKSLSTGAVSNLTVNVVSTAPSTAITTTTTVTDHSTPPTVARVDLVTTIAVASGNVPASGVVDFVDKTTGKDLGTVPVSSGRAELVTSGLTAGIHVIVASFGGVAGYATSQFVLTLNVQKEPTVTRLSTSSTATTAGKPVTLTATVAPSNGLLGAASASALSGTVTFKAGTTTLGVVKVNAAGQAAITTSMLPVGSNVVTATYSGDPNDLPSPSPSVTVKVSAPVSADGPRVVAVSRYGYHALPTTLVLTFSAPLDPVSAQNARNYLISGPSGAIRVCAAVYNSISHTVTLYPVTQLDLHKRYTLTVVGIGPAGVKGASGNLLDGTNTGRAGSDFVVTVDASFLVVTNPYAPGAAAALRLAAQVRAADARLRL